MPQVDAITLQVVAATLSGIVREMQNSLYRTGYSTIIRESHDASCAILDAQGRVGGQPPPPPLPPAGGGGGGGGAPAPSRAVEAILRANSRTPDLVVGDL